MRFSVFVATFAAAIAPFALAQNNNACGQCDNLSQLGECSAVWRAALAVCEGCGYKAPEGVREKCAREYVEETQARIEEERKQKEEEAAAAVVVVKDKAETVKENVNDKVSSLAAEATEVVSSLAAEATEAVEEANNELESITTALETMTTEGGAQATRTVTSESTTTETASPTETGSAADHLEVIMPFAAIFAAAAGMFVL